VILVDSGPLVVFSRPIFRGRGGLGVVIDGCLRDSAAIKKLALGLRLRGVTPNFHTQTNLFPFAVNVPVAVFPGDLIIADDGAAVRSRRHVRGASPAGSASR
jgi:regulator of RNase E activity RraA